MTYTILHALAPIFVIMLLGFMAGKAKMVDNKNVALLNIFVMDFALPAALFSATVQTPWSGIVEQMPLGVVLSALGIHMPDLVLTAIRPLGLAATAAALFLTGLILSARQLKLNGAVALSSVTKLLIQPLIAWALVLALGLHGSLAITSILMVALSAGFFGVVFGNRFGVQSPDAEATLLITSVLCIVTLPLFISLTAGM